MPDRHSTSRHTHTGVHTWVRGAPKRKNVPVSDEERAFVRALHAEHPNFTWTQLGRLAFREFGHDRGLSTIRRMCAEDS